MLAANARYCRRRIRDITSTSDDSLILPPNRSDGLEEDETTTGEETPNFTSVDDEYVEAGEAQ